MPFDHADIVDAADVGVRNLAGDTDFVAESGEGGLGHFSRGQKLQCDRLVYSIPVR